MRGSKRLPWSAFALACGIAVAACNTSNGGDAGVDAPSGPLLLFSGRYAVTAMANIGSARQVVGAAQSIRTSLPTGTYGAITTALASGGPLDVELAALDARFAGPDAAMQPWSPGRLVHDAASALQSATDDASRAIASARLDAAMQLVLVLAAQDELAHVASAVENPGELADGGAFDAATDVPSVEADGAPIDAAPPYDWSGMGDSWDRTAVYVSALSDDIVAIQSTTAFDVSAPGTAPVTHDDVLAQIADVLLRGRGSASAKSASYAASLTSEARALLTRPFLLATLARATPSNTDAVAHAVAAVLHEAVLQPLATWSGADASAQRGLFAGTGASVDSAAVVRADATLYLAVADSLLAGFDAGTFVAESSATGGITGEVEALADPLARSGIDPLHFHASLQLAGSELALGNVADARARLVEARNAIATLVTTGGR